MSPNDSQRISFGAGINDDLGLNCDELSLEELSIGDVLLFQLTIQ